MIARRLGLVLLIAFIININYSASGLEREERPLFSGIMMSKAGEYAVKAFREEIRLYDPSGRLREQYKPADTGRVIVSYCISDIDGDAEQELLIIEGDAKAFYGDRLVILSCDNGLKKRYERVFKELNPWKVQSCDVDGDQRKEISLGVYKKAVFHPVMAKRPFLYHWNGEDIVPMWRGSRLSRPFDDYIFFDLDSDGKDEILSIERLQDGEALINAYGWAGFGFESVAESMPYEDIAALFIGQGDKESLMIQAAEDGRPVWIELAKVNEQLIEKTRSENIARIKERNYRKGWWN